MPSRITSRLAAHAGTRQVEAVLYADAAGDAADRAIHGVWRKLLALLRSTESPFLAERYARIVAHEFEAAAHEAIEGALRRLATWAYRTAATNVVRTLPVDWLAAAAVQKHRPTPLVRESLHIEEDDADPSVSGLIHLFFSGNQLSYQDALGRLREPTRNGVTVDQARELFRRVLFPPLPAGEVTNIVRRLQLGAETWEQRLRRDAQRFNPQAIAQAIGAGYAAGKNQREIAKDLLPAVNGLKVNAMRLARTYGMHVAGVTNQRTAQQLGDLRVGDQVHATLDENTRPLHRDRNGTVYYFVPHPGEKDYSECPQPPAEANGEIAWNCRCWISPVLRPPQQFTPNAPQWRPFLNAQKELVPDPAVYAEWFQKADEKRRRLAVGTGRYSAVAALALDVVPHYEHFVDVDGHLLTIAALQAESPEDRGVRLQKVRAEMRQREQAIRQVGTFGFVPPSAA